METCAIERHLTSSSNKSPEPQDPGPLTTTDIYAPQQDGATSPAHAKKPTSPYSLTKLGPATAVQWTTPTSSDSQPLLGATTAGELTTSTSSDNRVPVVARCDHGRAKHDRAMNSSVGVGAIIGLQSSKILGYDSQAKYTVSARQRLKMELCSRAWLSPELVRVLQDYGSRCCSEHSKIFTARGYQTGSSWLVETCCWWRAATIKRLREEIAVVKEKWAELSHAIKNLVPDWMKQRLLILS